MSSLRMLIAATLACAACQAGAQAWPGRPLRWVVTFSAGGSADVAARLIAPGLAERLGQPVIIDNRPGAAGNIGMEAVARASPDGHTLLFGITTLATAPHFYKLSFNPLTDLAPVTQMLSLQFVLIASTSLPAASVPELLALARQSPGSVTCASVGGITQLGCALLRFQGGIALTDVTYKGTSQAMNDLIGGQVSIMMDAISSATPQVRAGRVRAIATGNATRRPPFSSLPTVAEALPGFELVSWQGMMVPAGTPREVVTRLNRETAAALAQPDTRLRLSDLGLEVSVGTPEAFGELIRRDHEKYGKLIREAGLKAD